ncbi:MAG: hypothetical protein WCS52_02265 [bacterium]
MKSTTKTKSSRKAAGLTVTGNPAEQFDRWRQQFNPLRGLTIARAVSMFEAAQRGDYSDIQWAYRFIERRDEDLIALIERRVNVITQMDWNVKIVDEKASAKRGITLDDTLAKAQAQVLLAAYNRITNLYEAIEHMSMAAFREFSICQFQAGDQVALPGEATHIECLNQWNIARDGMHGDWYWNQAAKQTTAISLGAENKIDTRFTLIREWPRPLDEIGLLKFIRSNLSRKNWDAFVEIYGIPGWIVIMPQNVPPGKEAEYMAAAQSIAEGRPGALPFGSDAKCADQARGTNPFRDAMQYLSEKLVLAGTGGLLTMLTESGSGTLAGSAHMEAFNIVARGEARKISELFQAQFDAVVLEAAFPGQPKLAYFELAANEEQDVGEILDHAVKIKNAGGQVDWVQLSEKTGYTITAAPQLPTPAPVMPGIGFQLPNRRSPAMVFSLRNTAFSKAVAADLEPIRKRFEAALALPDAEMMAAIEALKGELPELLKEINTDPESAKIMAVELQAALEAGMKAQQGGSK